MQPVDSKSSVVRRVLAGVSAGAIVGLIVEGVLSDGPPANRWMLLLGPAIGAAALAITAAFFGQGELRGWFKTVSICVVIGLAVGGFGGTIVFPAIMEAIEGRDPIFHEKIQAVYANVGFFFGVPIGVVVGIIVGFAVVFWNRRSEISRNSAGNSA